MFLLKHRKGALLIILAAISHLAVCQLDTLNAIKYTPDFKFKEGIFVDFDQVKRNSPIPKSSIITAVAYDDPNFYELVLKEKKIQVFDHLGTKQEIPTKDLWGYSRNGVLHINVNEGSYRITIVGSICHFVASLTTYQSPYNSYYPYSGYGYPYYANPYNPYYSPYGYGNTTTSEMRQYLLDFKTGNVLEYDEESVGLLLMADPELHDEFSSLSNKKQKQMKFLYIRKFNTRNPLYFPKE